MERSFKLLFSVSVILGHVYVEAYQKLYFMFSLLFLFLTFLPRVYDTHWFSGSLTFSKALISCSSVCVCVGGGVLLVEAMLFENHGGPVMAQLFSLNMLVQTEGKEQPPSHYAHMLTAAGFTNVQVCRSGKSYDAILALK